jgi:hypothetical protein
MPTPDSIRLQSAAQRGRGQAGSFAQGRRRQRHGPDAESLDRQLNRSLTWLLRPPDPETA